MTGKKVAKATRPDTMGLLLAVVVHPANPRPRWGEAIDKLIGRFPRLRLIWADAGYSGQLVDWVTSMSGHCNRRSRYPRTYAPIDRTASSLDYCETKSAGEPTLLRADRLAGGIMFVR